MKTGIVAAVLGLMALAGMVQLYQEAKEKNRTAADPYRLTLQPLRLAEALQALPPSGVVGYVSDLEGYIGFDTMQYTIAPRMLMNKPNPGAGAFVIGNFSKPLDFAQFGRDRGLEFVKDCGNGVVLYRVPGGLR